MKVRAVLVAAMSAAFLGASLLAAEAIKLDGVKCVVNPKAAVKEGTGVDYKGGQVFFCCQNCPKAFAKDTAKFATKANAQLVSTKQAKQVKCPITGKDVNPDKKVSVAGNDVGLCCDNCKGKIEKASADEQLDLVFSDKAFEKAYKVGEKEKAKK